MPETREPGREDYVLTVFPAPADTRGNPIDLEYEPGAVATLHERVDDLDKGTVGRSVRTARRYGLDDSPSGADLLHRAIDRLLGYQRFVVTLQLDGTTYVVTGEEFGEQHGIDDYALVAALGESGITEAPIPDADLSTPPPADGPANAEPIASWIAGLILETDPGRRLAADKRDRLGKWWCAGVPSSAASRLTAKPGT